CFQPHAIKAREHVRQGQYPVDLIVQPADDLRRRRSWREKTYPRAVLEAGKSRLRDRRDVGERGDARQAGRSERPQPPALYMRDGRRHGEAGHLDLVGDGGGERGATALKRDVRGVEPGKNAQQIVPGQMGRSAYARSRVSEIPSSFGRANEV